MNQAPGKAVVYLTKSDTNHHAEGCPFLGKSKVPITSDEAKKYEPCPVCKPPK